MCAPVATPACPAIRLCESQHDDVLSLIAALGDYNVEFRFCVTVWLINRPTFTEHRRADASTAGLAFRCPTTP